MGQGILTAPSNKPVVDKVIKNQADAFSTSKTYAVGEYCIYNDTLYRCTTAVTTAGAWSSANWTATSIGKELGNIPSKDDLTNMVLVDTDATTTEDVILTADNAVKLANQPATYYAKQTDIDTINDSLSNNIIDKSLEPYGFSVVQYGNIVFDTVTSEYSTNKKKTMSLAKQPVNKNCVAVVQITPEELTKSTIKYITVNDNKTITICMTELCGNVRFSVIYLTNE